MNSKKRLTAEGVLAHPWITGQTSEKKFQSSHNDRLRQLQARRKLRRGVQMVLAVNKFSALFREGQPQSVQVAQPRAHAESKGEDSDDD